MDNSSSSGQKSLWGFKDTELVYNKTVASSGDIDRGIKKCMTYIADAAPSFLEVCSRPKESWTCSNFRLELIAIRSYF